MTREEYETLYVEALNHIRRTVVGKLLGQPETTPAGTRFLRVDGMPCNDEVVFTMAWGGAVAKDIMSLRPASTR